MSFCAAVFDFDGTIADTSEGIFNCIRYALDKQGLPGLSQESMNRFIGPSLQGSFERECSMTPERAAHTVEIYRSRYSTLGLFELKLYDGIVDTLRELKNHGVRLALASTKPQTFLDRIAERFSLTDLFDTVAGSDPTSVDDDKSGTIARAITALGVTPGETIMVGDRKYDIDGAKKLGIRCAAVLYGFGAREEFEEHGADFIVASHEELKSLIIG